MVGLGSRTATALAGLVASVALSAAAWVAFDSLLLFLFVPFVPFLFSWGSDRGRDGADRPDRECPACGFHTDDPRYDYCPRDGTPLDRRDW